MASFWFISLLLFFIVSPIDAFVDFNEYYYPLWGQNHITFLNQSTEVQLLLDRSSGNVFEPWKQSLAETEGAGFKSKLQYESGLFTIRMKIPNQKSGGIITAFFLTSDDQVYGGNHDEIDFEFVGTKGKLQTNLFANDTGGREQAFQLPFDPSEDYHTYQILYSPQRIVFFVDSIPIRTFSNNIKGGVNFPTKPMWVVASLWFSESADWAGYVDWAKAPFIAYYQDFDISGCCPSGSNCSPSPYLTSWTRPKIDPQQWLLMMNFRKNYMVFNYCTHSKLAKYPECRKHKHT